MIKKGNRNTTTRMDENFKKRLNDLGLNASALEGRRISMRELTRRMSNTLTFGSVEKEILDDAKIKKELKIE